MIKNLSDEQKLALAAYLKDNEHRPVTIEISLGELAALAGCLVQLNNMGLLDAVASMGGPTMVEKSNSGGKLIFQAGQRELEKLELELNGGYTPTQRSALA